MPVASDVRVARRRSRLRRTLDAAVDRALSLPRGDQEYSLTRSVPVTMRDGVDLLTDVYAPVVRSRGTLLIRTPYGRTGPIAAVTARVYAAHGYHVVNQSCRGTSGSGGWFDPFVRELDDGADTVAWLRAQPWFGGRFAVVGPSYLGWTAWAIMVDPPPELATAVIEITAHDNHWVVHGAGAFALEQVLSLLAGFGHYDRGMLGSTVQAARSARALKRSLNELPLTRAQETVLAGTGMPYAAWLTATDPDDPLWRPMRFGAALERVKFPVLLQGGWQDRFTEQQLDEYARLHERGVPVRLIVGGWTHVQTATKGSGLVTRETLHWLDEHLAGAAIGTAAGRSGAAAGERHHGRPGSRRARGRDSRSRSRTPRLGREPVQIQVTGTPEWRGLPSWPPATSEQVWFLHPGGILDASAPATDAAPSTFAYDPADPTPAVGGRIVNPAIGGRRDNRRLESRADVLTFTSTELSESLEVLGRPEVRISHTSDNPNADVFVRLCEVHPDGRSINLSDGFVRLDASRTNGFVTIELETLAHRFGIGSRLRLQISGGAHPRFARNLGTGGDPATGTKLAPSRRSIGHDGDEASRLLLPCAGRPDSVDLGHEQAQRQQGRRPATE